VLTTRPFADLKKRLSRHRKRCLLAASADRNDNTPTTSSSSPNEGPDILKAQSDVFSPDALLKEGLVTQAELDLFHKEMADVVPLSKEKKNYNRGIDEQVLCNILSNTGHAVRIRRGNDSGTSSHEDQKALQELKALLKGELPIKVDFTPEYIQGYRGQFGKELVRRLHKGCYAIQGYCDLHGMDSITALENCQEFMSEALKKGWRCIAFIHGRGLCSQGEPVLKKLVAKWLAKGPFRRYVIAFSSAPSWDGGAGVTYVLIKSRPFKPEERRKKQLWRTHARG